MEVGFDFGLFGLLAFRQAPKTSVGRGAAVGTRLDEVVAADWGLPLISPELTQADRGRSQRDMGHGR